MKIGYSEKTNDFFITEMTRMEAGVIFSSVSRTLTKFKEAKKEIIQKASNEVGINESDIEEMIKAHQDIIEGLVIAKKMQMDSAI